jgi:hypothetical protein
VYFATLVSPIRVDQPPNVMSSVHILRSVRSGVGEAKPGARERRRRTRSTQGGNCRLQLAKEVSGSRITIRNVSLDPVVVEGNDGAAGRKQAVHVVENRHVSQSND